MIEIEEWHLSNLREWTHRLQQQCRAISGLVQAIQTLYVEAVSRLERLPHTLDNMENQLTGLWRESANAADQAPMSISAGSIQTGEGPPAPTSTATTQARRYAPPSKDSTPEAATVAPSRVKSRRRSGLAGKRRGKSKGSPLKWNFRQIEAKQAKKRRSATSRP